MQTIERKTSTLKSVHLDHCNRLQQKYQQDIELLDDLRVFVRQRAVIEKAYAESLDKLVQQSLVRRQFPKAAGETAEDARQSNMTLKEIWKNVIEETRSVAMVRLAAAESYVVKISEQCRQVRANRSQIAKMVFDELNSLQKDISMSMQESNRSQKIYRDEEHIAHEARLKAENINNKIKNKATGLFTSLAKLQQQSSKINARVEACEVKSTAARNEYILNLRAANAHLHRYYTVDLPNLMQALDGEYYDVWSHFLTLLSTTELQCSSATTQCFNRVTSDISKISRQYNTECFLKENPVLTDLIQYPFVPQDNDPIAAVSKDHQADIDVEREARKWATRIARENRTIHNATKALSLLKEEKNKAVSTSSEFLVRSQFAVSESKLEQERNRLRLAEIAKAKAEARIEALREGGVEVDAWLNSACADVGAEDEDVVSLNGSYRQVGSSNTHLQDLSKPTEVKGSVVVPNEPAAVSDPNDRPVRSDSVDPTSMVYPIWCVALYEYQAANGDELTIQENENLQILGEGDGDGWLRARNDQGTEGLVPENYIRVWNPVVDGNAIDVNEENVDGGTLDPCAALDNPQLDAVEVQDIAPYAVNNRLMNFLHPAKVVHNPLYAETMDALMLAGGEKWARALFDYEATCEEELSFQEGDLIRVISTENSGVDDGWWRGEINDSVGLFPSLVVEELLPVDRPRSRVLSTSSEEPQTLENLSPNACSFVSVDGSMSNASTKGAINFISSNSHSPVGDRTKVRLSSDVQQSLLNDGNESAV